MFQFQLDAIYKSSIFLY